MKNIKLYSTLMLLLISAVGFQSCGKKGENDPAISFKSRDTRLAGNWDLVGLSETETTVTERNGTETSTTTSRSYSNGVEERTSSSGNVSTSNYEIKLEISKDGTIKYTMEAFDNDGKSTGVTTVEGDWNWTTTGKRKSGINIELPGNNNPINGTWDLNQLKNKEIIFSRSEYQKTTNSNLVMTSTGELSMTFQGK